MDKNAVFSYVEFAREELQKLVRQKAFEYGITESGAQNTVNGVINGRVLSKNESEERKQLVNEIRTRCEGKEFAFGFDIVMEEVAYTWFNRFIALRFMEVNNYLPSHTRVFSDDNGKFNPQIIKEAMTLDIYGIDRVKVSDLLQDNKEEELFKYLIILQCNELSRPMPKMFERIANYTELLFPNGLLKKGSIIDRLVNDISEDNWTEQVQIIGWMYQFYISEKKDLVNSAEENISKNTIGAVTQLFTPDWIVRYMAENSIGRIWLESYPDSPLKSEFKYYVDEATQEAEVQEKFEEIRYKDVNPEDIKIIEPCCGSGHILVYCFDLLYKMYLEKGYAQRDIATLILKNNLWGLDVDNRAAQLAYFSVMMKARSVDRTYLRCDENIPQQPRVYEILDSQPILQFDYEELLKEHRFSPDNISIAKYLVSTFKYGKVIGSLLKVKKYNFKNLAEEINEKIKNDSPNIIETEAWEIVLPQLKKLCTLAIVMSRKYDVLITNPPYLGTSRLEKGPKEYFCINYKTSKNDLCTMFMETDFTKPSGFTSIINMHSWMFIKTYEEFRKKFINTKSLLSLLHLGKHSFDSIGGEILQTCSFIFKDTHIPTLKTCFIDATLPVGEENKKNCFLAKKMVHISTIDNFNFTAGYAFSYWISNSMLNCYAKEKVGEKGTVITGMTIGDNEKYLRFWYEIDINRISFNKSSINEINLNSTPWIPYSKGGARLNWYGGYDYVVNWSMNKNFNRPKTTMKEYYLKKAITWPFITGDTLTAKILPNGFLWDVAGSPCFFDDQLFNYVLALLCSKVSDKFLNAQNPTNNVQSNDIANIPLIIDLGSKEIIDTLVEENINIMKRCWNENELSWDFDKHFLITGDALISESYDKHENFSFAKYNHLKNNEEKINELLIKAYDLEDELNEEINDSNISFKVLRKKEAIVTLISYLIGISFGRYSIDSDGVCFGGGDWNDDLYKTIKPSESNIIPILDDSYFSDDAFNTILKCLENIFGSNTLEENLKFISEAIGGNGTSRDNLKQYFINGFYKDHLKLYQKHPIYWLFDAGKFNSFKCLIYMHKYSPDLIAKIRTDYILPLLDQYAGRIDYLEKEIPSLNGSANTKARKELDKVRDQLKELSAYELKIHNLADQRISIDLDDGVKHNYELFKDVLAPLK